MLLDVACNLLASTSPGNVTVPGGPMALGGLQRGESMLRSPEELKVPKGFGFGYELFIFFFF